MNETLPCPVDDKFYIPAVRLWQVYPPILILVGLIGNIMGFLVMQTPQLKGSMTSLLLRVLAIVDSLALITGLFRQWIFYILDWDIRQTSSFMCKVHNFLIYWLVDYSAWIIVLITLERFIAVYFPFDKKRIVSKSKVITALIGVGILLILLNGHFFWTRNLEKQSCSGNSTILFQIKYDCTRTNKLRYFDTAIFPILDLTVFCVSPSIILITGNVLILCKLVGNEKRKRRYDTYLGLDGNTSTPEVTRKHIRQRHHRSNNMTNIILLVSLFFVLSTLPISIYLFIEDQSSTWSDHQHSSHIQIIWAVVNLAMYSNNALNFYLYCLSGPHFRQQLLVMLGFQKVKNSDTRVAFKKSLGVTMNSPPLSDQSGTISL